MTITAPTRITIEVHAPDPGTEPGGAVPRVTVAPVQHRDDIPEPAPYEPQPCHCLDEEDCTADHEHE